LTFSDLPAAVPRIFNFDVQILFLSYYPQLISEQLDVNRVTLLSTIANYGALNFEFFSGLLCSVSRVETLYRITAKSNNPQRSYGHLKIENFGAVRHFRF